MQGQFLKEFTISNKHRNEDFLVWVRLDPLGVHSELLRELEELDSELGELEIQTSSSEKLRAAQGALEAGF